MTLVLKDGLIKKCTKLVGLFRNVDIFYTQTNNQNTSDFKSEGNQADWLVVFVHLKSGGRNDSLNSF